MKYQDFIAIVKQHQTAQIKTVAFPGCCTMDEIPDVFASLLPEIIQILADNLPSLCAENQVLTVIGMQIGPPMLESVMPLKLKRIYNADYPTQHFCLVLQYLLLTSEQLQQGVDSWYGSETLMIDFTTGKIMDAEYYLSLMLNNTLKGICYGQIAEQQVENAWQQLSAENVSVQPKQVSEPQQSYFKRTDDYFNEALMIAL